jgi:hypothetical protein
LPRAGIACLAGGPGFHLEDAEVSQFDPPLLDQGLDDRIEGLLDDLLRLQLRHPDLFGNRFDDLFLGHVGLSSG